MTLRWGIIGASKIAHDFCVALNLKYTQHDHAIVAIYSRNLEKAKNLANDHRISRVYSNIENLARDDQVEIVYVSLTNSLHYEVCKTMIEHGKHVLCEKPLGINQLQVKEIIELAKKNSVFVIEGLWSRFFPLYRYLSRLMDMKALSGVKEVYVKHGYVATEVDRVIKKDMSGGIVLDIGSDAIQFVVFIYKEEPKSIKASGKINSDGVDLHFQVEMTFSGNRKAMIICSGLQVFVNQATVISKKGPICIPDYNCPTKLFGWTGAYEWSLISPDIPMNFKNTIGLRYEADEVMKSIRSGNLESSVVPAKEMLLIAKIRDEIRKQIGVHYSCDKS